MLFGVQFRFTACHSQLLSILSGLGYFGCPLLAGSDFDLLGFRASQGLPLITLLGFKRFPTSYFCRFRLAFWGQGFILHSLVLRLALLTALLGFRVFHCLACCCYRSLLGFSSSFFVVSAAQFVLTNGFHSPHF